MNSRVSFALSVLGTVVLFPSTTVCAQDSVSFSRDVQPILSENCFFCHGPDEQQRQADLRLDTEEGAVPVLGRDAAVSTLLQRINSQDHDEMMPPPESNRTLTGDQKQILQRWIAQGAPWGKHWSFEPLTPPSVPSVDSDVTNAFVRNPIDSFVQENLLKNNLTPSAEADRSTLIRRVTLDLTGLPPRPETVQAFLANESPQAYEELVDQLLRNPAYGERMAWEWLNAARYADSNGYQGDRERTMWPWRDWVVSAFNDNMPFDQFSTLQLAGDLLPDATFEQTLATGFCRNHMINGEGGRIPAENRVDYVMDMTETMGTVWLGLTLNCCRCHDHKFDPLLQQDYYQFFAFFNQTPVTGGGGDPQTPPNVAAPTIEQRARLEELDASLADVDGKIAARNAAILAAQAEWEQEILARGLSAQWQVLKPLHVSAVEQNLKIQQDRSVLAQGPNPATDTYTVIYELPESEFSVVRLETLRHPTMTHGGLARSDSGNFVLTGIEFSIVQPDGTSKTLIPQSARATFEQGGLKIAGTLDGDSNTGWAVHEGRPVDRSHAAGFQFAAKIHASEGTRLQVILRHESKHVAHNIGRFRIAISNAANAELVADDESLLASLQTEPGLRTDDQKNQIRNEFMKSDTLWNQLTSRRQQLTKQRDDVLKQAPRVMVMAEQPNERETFILERGLYNQPTEHRVSAAMPASLPRPESSANLNRLQLARWLFSDQHPLTARVTVNRFWQQFFGTGLVKTTEDFGVQGEYPVQKELLDWLAADFRDHGWDVRRLVKTIVMSHTYRQSSAIRDAGITDDSGTRLSLHDVDPGNRLLARASRFRMPSWMLRDQALAVSGLLNDTIGGPPVNTYQPDGVWEEATFGKKTYKRDTGDNLYRRSLYIFWRRIVAPTMFFDNASRQTCTVKVLQTNTPLHSLLTLNETTYVEASRVLAAGTLTDHRCSTDLQRLQNVFLRIVCRTATPSEQQILLAGLNRSRREFADDADAARRIVRIGESPHDEALDETELAAWTSLCLAVLNLDETISRE